MWIVAGVLLGGVVLTAVAGLHIGPHSHFLSSALGIVAAIWLIVMIASGNDRGPLFALLGADLAISAGLGTLAFNGLRARSHSGHSEASIEGARGLAVSALDPIGVVRVRGEEWSAESVTGLIAPGTAVQVIGRDGVRLQVWAEGAEPSVGRPLELGELGARGAASWNSGAGDGTGEGDDSVELTGAGGESEASS